MANAEKLKASTHQQKVKWLLEHHVHLAGKFDLRKTAKAMQRDGLLAPSTYWLDAATGIKAAVRAAKLTWYAEHNGQEVLTQATGKVKEEE